jgi:hypothetical protein
MTPTEQFVFDLSQAACLKLWTYANPCKSNDRKELCDVLVVCQPDVVIFSVKNVALRQDGDPAVQLKRWQRRAIDASVNQVYGAERHLRTVNAVTASDGSTGVGLGDIGERRVHRVAVAIGSNATTPLASKDFGKGFVHVFDEISVDLLLRELDTVTDLVDYLAKREQLLTRRVRGIIVASEADLLATYLSKSRSFDHLFVGRAHLRIVDLEGAWEQLVVDPRYLAKQAADEVSYVWDRLINDVHDHYVKDDMEFGGDLHSVDSVTRVMARENRVMRRGLGGSFTEFMADRTPSRIMMGSRGAAYVFLKLPHYRRSKISNRGAGCAMFHSARPR